MAIVSKDRLVMLRQQLTERTLALQKVLAGREVADSEYTCVVNMGDCLVVHSTNLSVAISDVKSILKGMKKIK